MAASKGAAALVPPPGGELLAREHRCVGDHEEESSIGASEDRSPEAVEVLAYLSAGARRERHELAVDDALVGQQLDELGWPTRRRVA
jgi:hypothetical protein